MGERVLQEQEVELCGGGGGGWKARFRVERVGLVHWGFGMGCTTKAHAPADQGNVFKGQAVELFQRGPRGARGLGAGGRSGGSGGMAAQHGRNRSLTVGMCGGWRDCFSGVGGRARAGRQSGLSGRRWANACSEREGGGWGGWRGGRACALHGLRLKSDTRQTTLTTLINASTAGHLFTFPCAKGHTGF